MSRKNWYESTGHGNSTPCPPRSNSTPVLLYSQGFGIWPTRAATAQPAATGAYIGWSLSRVKVERRPVEKPRMPPHRFRHLDPSLKRKSLHDHRRGRRCARLTASALYLVQWTRLAETH